MPVIQLTRDLGSAPGGSSGARIMADAAGNKYFVKFKENAQGLRIISNDYLGGKIAQELQLPCPPVFLVEFNNTLAGTLPPINGSNISSGVHFASKEIENLYGFPSAGAGLMSQCINRASYPLIILFDALLHNTDRNNAGNYLFSTDQTGLKFNIIDHGHCFEAYWTIPNLNNLKGAWHGNNFSELYGFIQSLADFDLGLASIEALSDNFFTNLVGEIPDDWLPLLDKTALIDFLIFQRDHIRQMVINNKAKFPNCV